MFKEIIISMRPQQWYKNLILFIALIFSLNFTNLLLWKTSILAFITFCILSGTVYIFNDILDIKKDKQHPEKCKRPIASGNIKVYQAYILNILFTIISLILAYKINLNFMFISIFYLILMIIYSSFLKHLVIIDILTISLGFIIRAIAGAVAIGVVFSPWLLMCTFLLATFLVVEKRKSEKSILGKNAENHRKVLKYYSNGLLNQLSMILCATLIISYSLYASFAQNKYLVLTIPIVIYGIFRYLFLAETKNIGGNTEKIFTDKSMIFCLLTWIISVILIFILSRN